MARNTVSQTAPRLGRSSETDDERFKREVRRAVNQTYSTTATLATNGAGGAQTIWSDQDPVPFDSDATVQVKVKGVGAADPATHFAYYEKLAFFSRASTGIAGQNSSTVDKITPVESDAGFDCTVGLDSQSRIRVQVNDGAVARMDWKVWVEIRRDT